MISFRNKFDHLIPSTKEMLTGLMISETNLDESFPSINSTLMNTIILGRIEMLIEAVL